MLVDYSELHRVMRDVLVRLEMDAGRADLCATLFADASRDGFASHGLNRFPRFVAMIRTGLVDVRARPALVASRGAVERWDGRRGPGNLNAHECMDRAMDLAREHGLGAVGLANTNHWMRGGSYGWQAADAGMIGICWSNTLPNLPPWGTTVPLVGNNPFVIAVPRASGHVVIDMAMSQFSYGALAAHRMRGEELPVVGGFDAAGELTRDPAAIEATQRLLPIGFWKGSGLALLLDMVAVLLSGGRATHEFSRVPEEESGQSQVFLAIDVSSIGAPDANAGIIDRIVDQLHAGAAEVGETVRYPGERTLETRRQSLALGVTVNESIWREVGAL
ncbi:MAG: Malate/L-lactate dehydrogenase [Gemmatimonadetes bacterium]|nr:Malate/L-lactate dehydrogenase [Gemmatimonadota bacterium]